MRGIDTQLEDIAETTLGDSFLTNTTAFSVLFIYMWKDLSSLYSSTWFYINFQSKKQGGILNHFKDAAENVASVTKHIVQGSDATAIQEAKRRTTDAKISRVTVCSVHFCLFSCPLFVH